MTVHKVLLTLLALVFVFSACSKKLPMKQDPFYDSFFDMTRHIMSSEEIEIYRHLPDREAKEEFIAEFWLKRDPDPNTEENESLENFQERIEYANRWFDERKGRKRGWDTLRGRILLQLGFPEERRWGHMRVLDANRSMRDVPTEIWYYYRHQLLLTFSDRRGYGEYELESIPATLLTAIDNSKYAIDSAMYPNVKHAFKFSAEYQDGQINITIPTKRLFFNEDGERLSAEIVFTIYVYKDYRKIETIVKEIKTSEERKKLLEKKEILLQIPYSPEGKGQFHLDIVAKDLGANQRFRNFCQLKN